MSADVEEQEAEAPGGLYWDKQEISITNNSGSDLTLSNVGPLEHGEWDKYPIGPIKTQASDVVAFRTRSVSGSYVAPGPGTVSYALADGTQLNINFRMAFAVAQKTWVQATAGGPRGDHYTVTITCHEKSWHGQGRRFYATITLTASSQGPNSAKCSCRN